MQFKVPSLWRVFVALLFVPVGWLIIWLLFGWLTHTSTGSASDLSGLLAALGGIMGAIFTVGGLILALVTVLSQITLEDRAKHVMEDKFKELAPEFEKRADHRIAGRIAFRDAEQALADQKWGSAEAYADQALEHYPELPNVRSTVALAIAKAVTDWFSTDLLGPSVPVMLPMNQGYPVPKPEPPTVQAIEQLNSAQTSGDDPQGLVSAYQGLIYGVTNAYDKMLTALERAIKADQVYDTKHREMLLRPERLPLLVQACNSERARVNRLGEVLSIQLPVSIDVVKKSLDQIGTKPFVDHENWYAIALPLGAVPSRSGLMISLYKREDGDLGWQSSARIFPHGGQMYAIPTVQSEFLPVDELMRNLDRQFLFICQTEAHA